MRTLLFRVSEQLFQTVQTDRVLADLRHEPEAASADYATAHDRRAAVPIGRSAELFEVHGSPAFRPPCEPRHLFRGIGLFARQVVVQIHQGSEGDLGEQRL